MGEAEIEYLDEVIDQQLESLRLCVEKVKSTKVPEIRVHVLTWNVLHTILVTQQTILKQIKEK